MGHLLQAEYMRTGWRHSGRRPRDRCRVGAFAPKCNEVVADGHVIMSEVTFIDSSGLHVLFLLAMRLLDGDGVCGRSNSHESLRGRWGSEVLPEEAPMRCSFEDSDKFDAWISTTRVRRV